METAYRSAELAYRADDGEGHGVLEGRMVPYGTWTEIRSAVEGHFMERILPGALTKTLAERAAKLRVLFQHGRDFLGAQPIATLEGTRDEDDGAYYRASLFPSLPSLLMDGLRAGAYGTSIAMRPLKGENVKKPGKSEHNPEGIEERTVTEASLREISVVTFPAYEGATATVRSLTDDFYAEMLVQRHPELLLELVRAQTEPTHSEPPEPEDQDDGKASRATQSQETQPSPKRDWLSTEKEVPAWRLP